MIGPRGMAEHRAIVPGVDIFKTVPRPRSSNLHAPTWRVLSLRPTMSFISKISSTSDDRSARLAGIALMLAGVCMFSFGDALGKFIVATYSVGQLMLLRACAALALLGPSIWRQR